MTGVFIRESRERFGYRDTKGGHGGKGHVMIKSEIEVIQLQNKELLGQQKLEEAREDTSLESSEGVWPC